MNNQKISKNLIDICKLHLVFGGFYSAQIIVYHAWQLITPEAVLRRWGVVAIFTTVVLLIMYNSYRSNDQIKLNKLLMTLISFDILFASFSVYTQRGMAARAVALYSLALITAALRVKKSTLLLAAALSIIAYVTTAIAYFVINFNEGFKIELYGEVGFYSAFILLQGYLLWAIVKKQ